VPAFDPHTASTLKRYHIISVDDLWSAAERAGVYLGQTLEALSLGRVVQVPTARIV